MRVKFLNILAFSSFCGHKYLKSRLVVAILNYSKITCTLFLTSIFKFLRPQKIGKFMHGGHFRKTLKKSHAYLHIVGNVIVKLKKKNFRPPKG